jgi:hypothetical protein
MSTFTRLSTPLAITAALLLGACATNQVDRQEKTALQAETVKAQVPVMESQIDATLIALDNLMKADQDAIKPAFDRYDMEVDRMEQHIRDVKRDAGAMTRDSEAYLSNWDSSQEKIRDAELRKESEQQRFALMDRYQRFDNTYQRTRSTLDMFLQNLQDIRTAIANDATPRGQQTVAQTDVVQRAHENGKELKTRLQAIGENADALATALSEPPAGGTKRQAEQQ